MIRGFVFVLLCVLGCGVVVSDWFVVVFVYGFGVLALFAGRLVILLF